ncbi:POTE ankyrin domain family member B-like isoform X2 [Anser cygnoides]|uniref:POTE ankyrin domain family member B-like isoform X2 n=1 Tax=Anser cygnoides TaxID=8845 RepID=UPI00200960B1|nr:ankyrin repeat domain-containing protein 26-like isoform X2 [Anser cygnoides]
MASSQSPGAPQGLSGATVGACRLQERQLGGLHGAAARGDLALLQRRRWLRKLCINWRDAEGRTPLHLACANGHVDVVQFLLRKKCKLNPRDNLKNTPLMKAVACKQENCVAVLLEHGADPNITDHDGNTALHLAVQTANVFVAEILLQYNAQIDALNELGYTPLALAVSHRCKGMAEFFLKKGANVNARDCSGRTILIIAAVVGDVDIMQLLLQHGADRSLTDMAGITARSYLATLHRQDLTEEQEEPVSSETTGESSADAAKGTTVPDSSCPVTTGGVPAAAEAEQEEDDDSCESFSASGIAEGGEMQIVKSAEEPDTLLPVSVEEEEGGDSCSDSEGVVRQLPQELPGALEEQPKFQAPLEDPMRCHRCLKGEKRRLQKELDLFKAKLLQLQEQHIWNLNCGVGLQFAIQKVEREITASCPKQQSLLVPSGAAIKLEERVQRLEFQSARLEATAQRQTMIIKALQKDLQASVSSPRNWQSRQ